MHGCIQIGLDGVSESIYYFTRFQQYLLGSKWPLPSIEQYSGQNNRIGLFEITTTATRGKLNVPILILWDSDGDGVVQVGLNDDGVFPG